MGPRGKRLWGGGGGHVYECKYPKAHEQHVVPTSPGGYNSAESLHACIRRDCLCCCQLRVYKPV